MKVIVDSSALIALMNSNDSTHEAALTIQGILANADWELLLPYEVHVETINLIGKVFSKQAAGSASHAILTLHSAGALDFTPSESSILRRATELILHAKGSPSFIDCLVMALATRHQTPYIFGFDATFKKNGYRLPDGQAV